MQIIESPFELGVHVGTNFGPSEWHTIEQSLIDRFAEATGDHQWIHVDIARAAKEAPGGKTIAHGYLVLSLTAKLLPTLYQVKGTSRTVNYGADRIRFLNPVPAGSRVRALARIKGVEAASGGVRCLSEVTIEVEGEDKPALVSETIVLYFV